MKDNLGTWSLRRRLTGRVLALVAGAWIATVALSAVVLNHEMNEMFDEELRALVETTVLFMDTAPSGAIPRALGVETSDGERVLRIVAPDNSPGAAPWPVLARDGFHDAPGWRILRQSAEGTVIEAAHAITWRREEMLEVASVFLVLAFPLIALLLWSLRRIVSAATLPVANLARDVAARGSDDLSPVVATGLPEEVNPLVHALDGYLARIQALRNAERAFAANAAHELRTPLATLRNRLGAIDGPEASAAIATVDALTRRVDRLLQLSRLDAGLGLGRGPADLIEILRLLISDFKYGARHAIRFDDSDLERLDIAADPEALAILLRNLIENALEHGTGDVWIKVTPDGCVIIRNPADTPNLPKRRHAAGTNSVGSGLGLSIVHALAQAMQVPLKETLGPQQVSIELWFQRQRGP